MNEKVDGLVLRAVNYRESDVILTVLTRQKGRITVKASGARRKGSRLAPSCQLFCYSEMSLYERSGRYSLDEGSPISQFYGLSEDIEKMALASYFSQVLMGEPEDSPGGEAVLRLALNSLYAVERGTAPRKAVKAAFELRYMSMCGYAPDLSECAVCGERGREGYINIGGGLFVCRDCRPAPLYDDMPMDHDAIEAARYIMGCDLKRLFSFKLPEKSMNMLSAFCERYLLEKTEQGYRALDFYKSLFDDTGD